MISFLGNFTIYVALLLSLYLLFFKRKVRNRYLCIISSILPFCSYLILVCAFIVSDFSIQNVLLNSSTQLPLIYKISASYASHEGSILLWTALQGLIAILYFSHLSAMEKKYNIILTEQVWYNGAQLFTFVQALFLIFIICSSNPFSTISFTPSEGIGLNPTLQDAALAIHPPILYLGNTLYLAIFVNAVVLLTNTSSTNYLIIICKQFSNYALALLSLGIGLGAWWAYRELGWGGYWFFDPVENISLLPWLVGIALHHFLITYQQRGLFLKWCVLLSLACYLLIIFGTLIVRSGIISSVHSFAFSPERGLYLFAIFITLFLVATWFLGTKQKFLESSTKESKQDSFILLGNIFWLFSTVIIILGLIYPIYCYFFQDTEVVIDPEYYKSVFVPIFIPIIFLAGLIHYLPRKNHTSTTIIVVISTVITIILRHQLSLGITASFIMLSSTFLIIQMLRYLVIHSHYFSKAIPIAKLSMILAHFGFGLLAISVLLNISLSSEIEFIGTKGESIDKNGFKIKLEDIRFSEEGNYFKQTAYFRIEDQDNNVIILKPENRLYKIEQSLSQEVDIVSFVFKDMYAVLSKIEQSKIQAKIYYQPMISFIWLSVLMIACGFFLSWWKKGDIRA